MKEISEAKSLPCSECKGFCCGPVPVTKQELREIKKYIKNQPMQISSGIKNQLRYFGTCIFYDQDGNQCYIYSVRPSICKAFGRYNNLKCFKSPGTAGSKNWTAVDQPIGLLSVDYTWKDFI